MSDAPSRHTYRETGPLAIGGMAELSLAQRDDGETVVVKRIRAPFDKDPSFVGLFEDEGRICASLAHPHLIRLLDQGTDARGRYLVFEHVAGTDLGVVLSAAIAAEQPLAVPEVFAIAIPLFRALAAAHEAVDAEQRPLELVHRDVSPGNVLLSEQGNVVLADFGVAASVVKTELTQAGELKGKFAYMAPEQTRGAELDARADLFAAGVILWECLMGRRLFDGPTDIDVAQAVREQQVPAPHATTHEIPSPLAELVEQLLRKEPAQRPASAREVAERLCEMGLGYGIDSGGRRLITHLVRRYPRIPVATRGAGADPRRRTQRVLGGATAAEHAPTAVEAARPWWRGLVALSVAVSLGLVGVAYTLRGGAPSEPDPPPSAQPAVRAQASEFRSDAGLAQTDRAPRSAPETPPEKPPESAPGIRTSVAEPAGRRGGADPRKPAPRAGPLRPPPAATSTRTTPPRPVLGPSDREAAARPAPAVAPPADPRKPGFGLLYLESEPWAHVRVDGAPLGRHTPLLGLRLPAGEHEIQLENPIFGIRRAVRLRIEPGAETRHFVDLTAR